MNDSVQAVFDWCASFANLERGSSEARDYRLDRMVRLLELLDHPELACGVVHVAGSKGKGSTSALIADSLEALGLRVGVYRSPHVFDWRERIACNREYFADAIYTDAGQHLRALVEDRTRREDWNLGEPTTFELLTLLAFLCFRTACLDCVVVEVGIGGRLDATNVVQPLVSVITHLELEHTDILGPTLAHIAREKGGIIKPGVPVCSAPQAAEAMEVIVAIARELTCPFHIAHADDSMEALLHQRLASTIAQANARLAWTCLHLLQPALGSTITHEHIARAFDQALDCPPLPGRLSLYRRDGHWLLADGAHTADSVAAALACFAALCHREGIPVADCTLLFSLVSGKREDAILPQLGLGFGRIIITRPGQFKHSDPAALVASLNAVLPPQHPRAELIVDESAAWEQARQRDLPVLILGSFHLLGLILPLVQADGYQVQRLPGGLQCP